MRYLKRALGLAVLAVATMMIFAGGVQATILTLNGWKASGGRIEAEAEGPISFHGAAAPTCQKSLIRSDMDNAGGLESTVSLDSFYVTFTECGSDTVTVLDGGSIEIHAIGGKNGTLTWNGAKFTVQLHRTLLGAPVTTHCIYETKGTHIGTFTGTSTTKGAATFDISAEIPQVETDAGCGKEDVSMTGNYKVSNFSNKFDVDYGGRVISAESDGAITLHGISITCQESKFEAEIGDEGGTETTARGPITFLSFQACGNKDTVQVVNGGSLELHETSGGNGTMTWSDGELTVLTHRTVLGFPITAHCIYETEKTHIGTFTGSSTTGSTATLDIGAAHIPRQATDGACESDVEMTGSYKFTTPDSFDADLQSFVGILTSPAGTKAAVGTKIKAESEGAIEFAGATPISCQKSAMEGEITSAGSESITVGASLSSLSFGECGNHTVTVLKSGSLEIHSLGGGKGTLTSTGAEITVLTHGVFLGTRHCIYKTNKTDIGTFTGSAVTGATAKLDIGPATTPQTVTDGACGSNAEWGGNYKITSPDYLTID